MTTGLRDHWAEMQSGIYGWVRTEMLDILAALNGYQMDHGIVGNMGEIGVQDGKMLIALSWLAREGEIVAGFDCFEDKHFNVDNSGGGNLRKSQENAAHFAAPGAVFSFIQTDSLALTGQRAMDVITDFGPFRFFSVDGGHTQRHCLSDLQFATQALSNGGVVMVDDYPHTGWPGVRAGVDQFFAETPDRLAPFLLASNKLFLTTVLHQIDYRMLLGYDDAVWEPIYGHPVLVVKGGGWPWP